MKKGATLYKRGRNLIIYPDHKTPNGIWIAGTPVFVLDEASSSGDSLALKVKEALSLSQSGVTAPSRDGFRDRFKPVLDAAGVKTWATFVKGTVCVSIMQEDGVVTLTPTRNSGSRGGFRHQNEIAIKVPFDIESLEGALRQAIEISE